MLLPLTTPAASSLGRPSHLARASYAPPGKGARGAPLSLAPRRHLRTANPLSAAGRAAVPCAGTGCSRAAPRHILRPCAQGRHLRGGRQVVRASGADSDGESGPTGDDDKEEVQLKSLDPGSSPNSIAPFPGALTAASLLGTAVASSLAPALASVFIPGGAPGIALGRLLATGSWAFWLSKGVQIVPQGTERLVETLGRYRRTLEPGIHFITPWLECISADLSLRETVLDVPPQRCITADNAPISADAVVYFRIYSTRMARYAVDDLVQAIQNLVLTQLRTEIGGLTLDDTFSARSALNQRLLAELDTATSAWGVKVTRVEVRDILPEASIKAALEKQMTAERSKRADVLESEGSRAAAVNRASGLADAQILQAEAAAKARVLEAEAARREEVLRAEGVAEAVRILGKELGLGADDARKTYLARVGLDVQGSIGSSQSSKVLFVDPASPLGGVVAAAAAFGAIPATKFRV